MVLSTPHGRGTMLHIVTFNGMLKCNKHKRESSLLGGQLATGRGRHAAVVRTKMGSPFSSSLSFSLSNFPCYSSISCSSPDSRFMFHCYRLDDDGTPSNAFIFSLRSYCSAGCSNATNPVSTTYMSRLDCDFRSSRCSCPFYCSVESIQLSIS